MNTWAKLGLAIVAVGAVGGAFYVGMKVEEDRANKKRIADLSKRAGPKLVDDLAKNASQGLQSLGVPAESVDAAINPPATPTVKTGEPIDAQQHNSEEGKQANRLSV